MDAFLEEIKKWAFLIHVFFSFLKELFAGTKLIEKLNMPVMVRIFPHHEFSSINWGGYVGRSATAMAAYEGQSGSKDRGDPQVSFRNVILTSQVNNSLF